MNFAYFPVLGIFRALKCRRTFSDYVNPRVCRRPNAGLLVSVVAKLVIIYSPHPVTFARALRDHPGQIAASQNMLPLRETKAERVMSENNFERFCGMFGRMGRGGGPLVPADRAHYRQAWAQPGALTGGLNYYRTSPLYPSSLAGDPCAAALPFDPAMFTVRVPTLILWGERDLAMPPVLLDGIEQVVPDVRI